MRKIIILILTVILTCSCNEDRRRKWMVVIDTGYGKATDTVYVIGDHICQRGWHSVEVYKHREPTFPPQYPSNIFEDVKYVKEVEK